MFIPVSSLNALMPPLLKDSFSCIFRYEKPQLLLASPKVSVCLQISIFWSFDRRTAELKTGTCLAMLWVMCSSVWTRKTGHAEEWNKGRVKVGSGSDVEMFSEFCARRYLRWTLSPFDSCSLCMMHSPRVWYVSLTFV